MRFDKAVVVRSVVVRNGEVAYGKLWRVVAVKARYVESRLVALRQGLLRFGSYGWSWSVKAWLCAVRYGSLGKVS